MKLYDEDNRLDYAAAREVVEGMPGTAAVTAAALLDIAETLSTMLVVFAPLAGYNTGPEDEDEDRGDEPDPNVEPLLEVGDWVTGNTNETRGQYGGVERVSYRDGELCIDIGSGWRYALSLIHI